jgi:hypothetical protein
MIVFSGCTGKTKLVGKSGVCNATASLLGALLFGVWDEIVPFSDLV